MNDQEKSFIYVWDAYCGWCYGFSNSIRTLHENHPEIPLTLVSGGLFVGERRLPIKNYPHISEANERISQLTGVEFGDRYEELLENGTFILDSEVSRNWIFCIKIHRTRACIVLGFIYAKSLLSRRKKPK